MRIEKTQNIVPALKVSGLSLVLGGNEILREVKFEISRGEFVSVVGPNGAGKSTLLRCVMGVMGGWSGTIQVKGVPAGSYRRRDLARLLSYVPQSDEKWFPFTGRELVLMGRYPYLSPFTRPGRADMEVVERALEATGTRGLADRDMRTLSGGERQKMLIAGALAQEAETMLLDEPTTFLDPRYTDEILAILDDMKAAGVTVVMVTHDINHASMNSDRVIALVSGSISFDGTPDTFLENPVLENVYGKRFTLVTHPVTGRTMALPGEAGK